jgi:AcrR family transcriptional regulator
VRRFDSPTAPFDLFADAWLRLYLAVSRDLSDNESDPVVRVSARYGVTGADDAARREALVEATQAVYRDHGWLGLTGAAVADRAGLPVVELMRLVGDRRGLAAAVWAGKVPRFARTLALLDGAPELETVVRGYLGELVSAVREDVAMSTAFLERLLSFPTGGRSEPGAPGSLVPLAALLTPLVAARMDQLDALDLEPGDIAELLVGHALYLASSRLSWSEERVVAVVMGTTYGGMRR